jgi:hypothetical protein
VFEKKIEGIEEASAMLDLVHRQWQGEEAKNVSAFVMLLGEIGLYRVAPEFKSRPIYQQTIAVAVYVAITKICTVDMGKDGSGKLFKAAADYARLHNETSFFRWFMLYSASIMVPNTLLMRKWGRCTISPKLHVKDQFRYPLPLKVVLKEGSERKSP